MNTHAGHYHLIGIGGIGMSGIAQLLLKRGVAVSGSDVKESALTASLAQAGARIFIGHDSRNIEGAGVVVYSSAIKPDNPEMAAAQRSGIPLIRRAEALAGLMKDKAVITVAGSHGKTTVTSMVSYLLLEAGLCPTAAIGGILRNIDTNAYCGDGEYFVAEADESDSSFLCYTPRYSIVTNIDREHLDHYRTFEAQVDAFRAFIQRTQDPGCIFCCADDANLLRIAREYPGKSVLFGLTPDAQVFPRNIRFAGLRTEFECICGNRFVSRFELALAGLHNVSNSLAVIALGLELGIDLTVIRRALSGYKGAGRRIEVKYERGGYLVIDDYAHHPTEINATLCAVKNLKPKRLIAVFQPHRYSRTQLLLDEFGRCFDCADHVIVTDIYAASEPAVEGITGSAVQERVARYAGGKPVEFQPKALLVSRLRELIRPGDLVITLGAGDISRCAEELVSSLPT